MTRLFLQLNLPGSGETTINQNDAAAPDIAFGKFIRVVYRGENRGGFFVDNIDEDDVTQGEEGERNVKVSGRGMMGILDNMIVSYAVQYEATVPYTSKKLGYILDDLLTKAKARGVYPNLIWDFNDIQDTNGEAWTVNHDLGFRVGSTLLEAVEQFVDLGADFNMSFTPGADQYVLSAYKSGIGSDKSASVVFQSGESIKKASKMQEASGLRNAMLIEVTDPLYGPAFVWDTRAPSIATYGRRETFFQAGNAPTIVEGVLLALAELDEKADPRVQYTLVVSDASGPQVFEDYDIGDIVGYLSSDGTIDLVRIFSLQLDFTKDEFYADVTIGLGTDLVDQEIVSAKQLQKIAPGITGGAGGPSDPAIVAGALIGLHDADAGSHSPYLRNANKIQGYAIVDPGVDTPVDNDFLQYSSIDARWDYVSFSEGGLDARYVEIAGDTMIGALVIDGSADTEQLVIQAHSTQIANIVEIQDEFGNVLSGVDERGVPYCDMDTDPSNLFFGSDAGNAATSGTGLLAIGTAVLEDNTDGIDNIAIGYNAMLQNTEGNNNTAIGRSALQKNTLGEWNTALGNSGLFNNIDGNRNAAFGYFALHDNISGIENIAMGDNALHNTEASTNVGIGVQAGYSNTSGGGNIFIGYKSGRRQTTNSNLLIIDNQLRADVATELTNAILYGVMAAVPADQTLRINAVVTIGAEDILFSDGGAIFNLQGNDVDFRIDTDNQTYAFFVDGGNNLVTARKDSEVPSQTIPFGLKNLAAFANFSGAGLEFRMLNDASAEIAYAQIIGIVRDVTAGSEDGQITFRSMKAGVSHELLSLTHLSAIFNNTGLDLDLRVATVNEPKMVVVDAALDVVRLGDGDTNYMSIDKVGDVTFVGGAGLVFAEIYANDTNTTITIIALGQANKIQVTSFDTNGFSNNMTPDHTNDHITVTKAGIYLCTVSISCASAAAGAADKFGFAIYKNNGAVEFANLHGHRKLGGGGGDFGSVSINGIIDLAVNDTIELWCWNEDSTDNLVVDDVTISLVQVGGT